MSIDASNLRGSWRGWLALIVPLLLLAGEIGLLTLSVEYRHGLMAAIAQPAFVQAALFAATLLLLVSGAQLAAVATPGWLGIRALWLIVNLACFALLYWLSVALVRLSGNNGSTPMMAVAWLGLALVVGISAILAGASWQTIQTWVRIAWLPALIAMVLGATLAGLTPTIRRSWAIAGPPTAKMGRALLELRHPGQTVLEFRKGKPILMGVQHARRSLLLYVTPACSEMESLAAYLILSVTLLFARWRTAAIARWLASVAVGLLLLWLLLGVRLALLVEVGLHTQGHWSTQLAHSRASGIFFLAASAAWLLITGYWWQPASRESSNKQP